jgi:diaminopimelate decarboxylase
MATLKEIFPSTTSFENDALHIARCDVRALAKEFGTPLFVMDEADLVARATRWREVLAESFGKSAGTVYYAAKAFISIEVTKILDQVGLGIDVCTGGELAVAQAANFPGDRIELHGNNKSEGEIQAAISYGVRTIVLDSLQEIERVARIANGAKKRQRVMIRLTPGVEAHTHEAIKTAHEDVKFGFSIASGAAREAVLRVRSEASLELVGVHAHIGSQIFVADGFDTSAQRLIGFLAQYRNEFGSELPELNLGGGYGIAYIESDNPISAQEMLSRLHSIVARECSQNNLSIPKVSIEPGRAIVGPTMVTLYEVGTTKVVKDGAGQVRNYISVDGGMSDNIRPGLYGAEYSILLANRKSSAGAIDSRVVGKHCETGDIVINDVKLPSDIRPGDILAVPATGAYGRSMASNYNFLGRPPVVLLSDGTARTIVRRENQADLLALDVEEAPRVIGEL